MGFMMFCNCSVFFLCLRNMKSWWFEWDLTGVKTLFPEGFIGCSKEIMGFKWFS